VNEFHNRNVRAADYVTNEMPAITWQEAEYHLDVCHVANGVHTKIH
jgi:hypothetical protein